MTLKENLLITVAHMRELHYCVYGTKKCAKRHNLDWRKFVREGIPAKDLLATGDAMAEKIVDYVENLNGQEKKSS